jgi:hypothetical protein
MVCRNTRENHPRLTRKRLYGRCGESARALAPIGRPISENPALGAAGFSKCEAGDGDRDAS